MPETPKRKPGRPHGTTRKAPDQLIGREGAHVTISLSAEEIGRLTAIRQAARAQGRKLTNRQILLDGMDSQGIMLIPSNQP